jgi:hypothetical protein
MAKTKHQTVTKVAPKAGGKATSGKNSDLKQAAHQGKAPVKDAKNAQPGYAAVPASVATLPPWEGPSMSSTPTTAARGRSKSARGGKSTASSGASAQVTQPAATVVQQQGSKTGGGKTSKRRGRAAKKR